MRIRLTILLLFLYLSHPASTQDSTETTSIDHQLCNDGCLKCSSLGKCEFCDIQDNTFLKNDTCARFSISNCQEYTFDGDCKRCVDVYYLAEGVCELIDESNRIPNCYKHKSPGVCEICEDKFILVQGECIAITTTKDNCLIYNDSGTLCTNCEGFVLSEDFQSCDKNFQAMANCKYYSMVTCNKCSSGYYLYPNTYIFQVFDDDKQFINNNSDSASVYTDYLSYNLLSESNLMMNPSMKHCKKTEVPNCLEFDSFNRCSVCQDNYYKTDEGMCLLYPEEKIQFCLEYESNINCKTCEPNFYKKAPKECAPVLKIDNCKTYDGFVESSCLKCESDFYLENGLCKERTVSKTINNCAENAIDRDACERCANGFETNSEGSICLLSISNCKEYFKTTTEVSCSICEDTYFLNSNKCILGAIDDCQRYESENRCSTCGQGSYLSSTICKKHTLIEDIGCTVFSTLSLNDCLTCNEDRVAFTLNNYCEKSNTEISNCLKYSADGICESCDSSISYLANNKCVLGTIAKCITYAPNEHRCLKCDTDLLTTTAYIPDGDRLNNSCVQANPNYHHNCDEVNEQEKTKCLKCINNYYPKINDFRMTRYCVSVDYFEFDQNVNLTNCSTFDIASLQCLICSKDTQGFYYYNNSGKCETSCADSKSVKVYTVENNNNISKRFTCESRPIFQTSTFVEKHSIPCHFFEYDHTLTTQVCSGCKSDEIGLLDWTKNQGVSYLFSYKMTTGTGSFFSIFNRITPVYSCLKRKYELTTSSTGTAFTQAYNASSSDEPNVDNCRFLIETNNEVYQCGSCNFGYTGRVVRTLDNYSYMLEKCEILPECKTDIFYNGLGSLVGQLDLTTNPIPIDYYVSCHLCEYSNQILIPTYGIVATGSIDVLSPPAQKLGIAPFGIPTTSNPTQLPYQVEEISQTYQTTCQIPGLTQVEAFPTNCGIQELQLDKALGPYQLSEIDDSTNPICVACSPMHKPVQDSVYKKAIVSCEPIANCSNSTTFNKCTTCQSGYSVRDGSDFTECIETTVRNCWIYSDNLNVCIQCLDGYAPVNGVCDFADLYKCSQRSKSFSGVTNLNDTLTLAPFGFGCEECETGFVGTTFNETFTLCVRSDALSNNTDHANNTWIIPNCKNYYLNNLNEIVCIECDANYITQEDLKKCYDLNVLPNCKTASNGGATCLLCEEDYFYDNFLNRCMPGDIPNCQFYSSESECSICKTGFFAAKITNSRIICFAEEMLHCADLDLSNAKNGIISCNRCSIPYFLRIDAGIANFPIKICLPIPQIEHCSEYEKSTLVTQSTLKCIKCIDSHYINPDTNQCTQRIYTIDTCQTYGVDFDGCEECQAGLYLAPSKKACIIYPTAIVGCIEFKDSTTCTKCGENRYLQSNECIMVAEDLRIEYCRYYKNSKECGECNNAYFLNNNKCTQAYASNCVTYVNAQECKTCKRGYGLSTLSNITSCVFIQVSNCTEPDETSIGPSFKCLTCVTDFYPDDDGVCRLVPDKIANCSLYSEIKTCSKCKAGYVLTNNSCSEIRELLSYVDPNCEINVLVPKCVSCKDQYYFSVDDEGKPICKPCTHDSNCQVCNPEKPTECLMCKKGFKMNKEKNCGGSEIIITEDGGDDNGDGNGDNGNDNNENSLIWSQCMIWLLLVIIL